MLSEKCRPFCLNLNVLSTYIVWQPNKDPSFIIHLMCLRCALRHSYVYYTRGCFPILISTYQYNESLRSSPYRLTAEDPTQLTHLPPDKMAAISQTVFSNAFSSMKMYKFLSRFHWYLFLRNQLTIFQHWFRWWLGIGQVTSHYLNQWWLVYWRIYASLWHTEAKANGHHFAIDVFKCLLFNENLRILIKDFTGLFPKGPIDNNPALVWIMDWCWTGTKNTP